MKLKHILPAVALVVLASGCNNLFDDAPMDRISDEMTMKNNMLLDEYVNGWYRNMNSGFKTYVPSNTLLKKMSTYYLPWFGDQLTVGNNNWFNAGYGEILKSNEQTITDWADAVWSAYYTQIMYVNTLIERQDEITDEAQRKRVLGEAHFFRAYYTYLLWQRFGGVFIIDHRFDPLRHAETFPRAGYADMVNYIVAEADKAAEALPASYGPENAGRVTRGAARMLKAKTYFWAASPVFRNQQKDYLGFPDDRSKDMLEKAKAAYEELFATNSYTLVPVDGSTQEEIADNYRKIFLMKNSTESILEVQHTDDGDYANKNGHRLDRDAAAPSLTGVTAAYTPTHNHVEEYGMREGKTYDPQNPYANRDYRFYANILYDGATFRGHVMDMHTTDGKPGADMKPYGTSESAFFSRTGYYMGKFMDEATTIDDNPTYGSHQNFIIWRLPEAMLDYAEVLFRLGDEAGARRQVNQIRKRAHMDELLAVTLPLILNERRVELAFEETTYWDYFRTGTAGERLNGQTNPLKAMNITEKNGVKTYRVVNLNRFPKRVRVFKDKQYYLPIPWSEVKYHGVPQNPEWNEY